MIGRSHEMPTGHSVGGPPRPLRICVATALRGVADEQSAEPAREPMAFFFVDAEAGSLGLGGTPGVGEEALRGAGVVKIRRKAQRVGAGMRSAHP